MLILFDKILNIYLRRAVSKEIQANDQTGIIKVTLWGNRIKSVSKDGVYTIKDAIVNEYNGVKSLNTRYKTSFVSTIADIAPSQSALTDLVSIPVAFPPTTIISYQTRLLCPKCSFPAEISGNKLFKCNRCGCVVLCKKLQHQFSIKAMFGESRYVTFFHKYLVAYYQSKQEIMPSEIDQVMEDILSDDLTEIIVDSKNNIINIV